MPQSAPSPCTAPGCRRLTKGGRCSEHQRAEYARDRARRGNATDRGYGHRWTLYSRAYRKTNPYCVRCAMEGRQALAELVDHITPVQGPTDPRFWDRANHQGLCWSCHSRKTATEDKGRTRKAVPRRVPATPKPASTGWVL